MKLLKHVFCSFLSFFCFLGAYNWTAEAWPIQKFRSNVYNHYSFKCWSSHFICSLNPVYRRRISSVSGVSIPINNYEEESLSNNNINENKTKQIKNAKITTTHSIAIKERTLLGILVAGWIGFSSFGSSAVAAGVSSGKQYWNIMKSETIQEKISANEGLMDYAVGSVNNLYYDNSGGAYFTQQEFYNRWRNLRDTVRRREESFQQQNPKQSTFSYVHSSSPSPSSSLKQGIIKIEKNSNSQDKSTDQYPSDINFSTRDGVVNGLKWMVSTLNDPYSFYLTRDELKQELQKSSKGDFLGLGAIVEPPQSKASSRFFAETTPTFAVVIPEGSNSAATRASSSTTTASATTTLPVPTLLNAEDVLNLPLVTAVTPYSKAERSGIVVGDRIVAVGETNFIAIKSKEKVEEIFSSVLRDFNNGDGEKEKGPETIVVAKPVIRSLKLNDVLTSSVSQQQQSIEPSSQLYQVQQEQSVFESSGPSNREVVIGYRPTKVRLRPQTPTGVLDSTNFIVAEANNGNQQNLQQELQLYKQQRQQQETKKQQQITQQKKVTGKAAIITHRGSGGDNIVRYELLSRSNSIFGKSFHMLSPSSLSLSESGSVSSTNNNNPMNPMNKMNNNNNDKSKDLKVGYIRLTRFSKASTEKYVSAIEELEKVGANAYIIDVRNNYGGVIQEAMLTASTLIRDPHAVLCYTLTSRGSFTPHDITEYIVDKRYPGYFLSKEPKYAAYNQVKRENPEMFALDGSNGWAPPSSFASLREQTKTRGIHRATYYANLINSQNLNVNKNVRNDGINDNLQWNTAFSATSNGDGWVPYSSSSLSLSPSSLGSSIAATNYLNQINAQKKIILLTNEGTASSAEVFAAALHDNGRTAAVIGTRTYGKGLIQHTIPMPDGGGLRLTVAEYLTPSLRHVTNVPNAKFFDRSTGEWASGGGIKPDIMCTESKQGIPSNIGADYCVGMALDVLQVIE